MTSGIKKGLFAATALIFVFTCAGGIANAQCGTRGTKPCVTKRAKAAAVKRRAARAKIRHKKAVATKPAKNTIAEPPRDANRYTIQGDSTPVDYRGPVTDGNYYTVAPGSSSSQNPSGPISGGVLNGKARALPAPVYPPAAIALRAGGSVGVRVLIDEKGDVIEAVAVSGNPLLRAASVAAARGAKFAPTKLSGQPVKVSGIITYNYVP